MTLTTGETIVDNNMDLFRACMIADGCEECDQETFVEAYQLLIDTGMAWRLQGRIGRQAYSLIEQGFCTGKVA